VNNARMEIVGAALDVLHLAMGPAEYLRSQALIVSQCAYFKVCCGGNLTLMS
jgi:hypothetical protein